MDDHLTIGDVAARTGLSIDTLRFYERDGLMISPVRRHGGRRAYDDTDVAWLEICRRLRESDMPLAEIRRFATLVRQGTGNEAERLELLRRHEERVRARMTALADALDVISGKVETYAQHVARGTAAGVWAP
ncbi:MerR family transcriptional regulator [Pseudonocardia sp. DSM 110487]|uniref:MerR family transcriptional regulator n=1 Tax=Pseudonocardia sp. DSM 110487 TaxID=2865833 RepID=UPI001C69941C|nr:MerR family transcriptional regulator [Pseudonocardia sp. DSM 110487]QYN39516.1 MerR family transcriptional regulator [Pseudonocardia sp. DSM 110487]